MSFQPDHFDMLGFGPGAISFTADEKFKSGFRVLNPEMTSDYLKQVAEENGAWNRYFVYDSRDLRRLLPFPATCRAAKPIAKPRIEFKAIPRTVCGSN